MEQHLCATADPRQYNLLWYAALPNGREKVAAYLVAIWVEISPNIMQYVAGPSNSQK